VPPNHLTSVEQSFLPFVLPKATHSGYPKNSGRVIRVVRNSGIKNCYLFFVLKKHYPKFRVPDNLGSGSGFTRYTRNWQNQPF
jgi:hypothetical protein